MMSIIKSTKKKPKKTELTKRGKMRERAIERDAAAACGRPESHCVIHFLPLLSGGSSAYSSAGVLSLEESNLAMSRLHPQTVLLLVDMLIGTC